MSELAIDFSDEIRLAHGWHLSLAQSRKALTLNGQLTARGLATRLGAKRSWVYRRIREGDIDPSYISRHPQSRVYLIKDDPTLIEHLQQRLAKVD